MDPIVNKVAQSNLLTIDLEEMSDAAPRMLLDIKPQLYMGLMLKEKEFRDFVKQNDWSQYKDAMVAVYCSSDAIVPTWAYMLITSKLSGIAKHVVFGDLETLEYSIFKSAIDALDMETYRDQRVVVKGCSDKPVPASAYVYLTWKLNPIVKSIMFGEPCSTVPVYKQGK